MFASPPSNKDIEPHEVLLDKLAKKREEELGISEKKFETPLVKRILQGVLFSIILLFLLLFAKTFQLQVIDGSKFSLLAQENKFIIHQIQAERGVVYDNNLNQLVFNISSFDLIYDKNALDEPDKERAFKEVSQVLKISLADLKKRVKESQGLIVPISENLDHQTLIILETKIDQLPGFQIKNNMVRDYLSGPIFSHLIGYKRKTGEKIGLESSYDEILRENPGEILTERDAKGKIISRKITSLPEPGKSLVLWLDSGLQKVAEKALADSLKRVGSKVGSVVALNPKTGGVLALVSLPSFDNNLFSKGMTEAEWQALTEDPLNPLFNRAIAGQYPTGSVIKPLIASAALEEKIISPEKKIDDTLGFIEIPHRYDPEIIYKFRDWKVHGWVDLKKAIAESCNVYFYTIGGGYKNQAGLGPTRIKNYLELFGWARPTGIDLPGESQGLVPSPQWKEKVKKEDWWDGDTYLLSIGQGDILATPLQVATAFEAIANGGKVLQPQIVQKIVDKDKNLIEGLKPKMIRENIIDPQNLEVVREGMRDAVIYGSSVSLNDLPIKVAAKTGTAQTIKEGYYHHWLTVFAPYEDPEIVLTITIEDVKGLGGAVLPVAKEILGWYFSQGT